MSGTCQGMRRIGKKHYQPCTSLGTIAIMGRPFCEACARRERARIDLERRARAAKKQAHTTPEQGGIQRALF